MRWTAVLCAVVLMGCSGADEGAEDSETSDVSCEGMQDILDMAENAEQREREAGNLEEADGFAEMAQATDERMAEVGCYD